MKRYVRLVKNGPVAAPTMPPGDPTKYPYGLLCETHSLPEGYTLEGWLVTPPVVGQCVEIARCVRNGVACMGGYTSTPVTLVQGETFHTANSIYRLVELPTVDPDHGKNTI
jgi:hypothetical protein